jgi:hypothetical protein
VDPLEAARADVTAAWTAVGDHMRTAMAQVEAEMTPEQRARLQAAQHR